MVVDWAAPVVDVGRSSFRRSRGGTRGGGLEERFGGLVKGCHGENDGCRG